MSELFIMFLIIILSAIALYVYYGFAYMQIGRRANLKIPELSWIPGYGPLIIMYQISKMHWWPWVLIGLNIILSVVSAIVNSITADTLSSAGLIFLFSGAIISLITLVMTIIWSWKTFVAMKQPGWWSLTPVLIMINFFVYFALLFFDAFGADYGNLLNILLVSLIFLIVIYHVFVGIAAWGKFEQPALEQSRVE